MVKVYSHRKMGISMKVNGRKINSMAKAKSNGKTKVILKVLINKD